MVDFILGAHFEEIVVEGGAVNQRHEGVDHPAQEETLEELVEEVEAGLGDLELAEVGFLDHPAERRQENAQEEAEIGHQIVPQGGQLLVRVAEHDQEHRAHQRGRCPEKRVSFS